MVVVHRYDRPDRFVVGTVGPPGQRTFFLQAREGSRVTSVALEKQQVAVLAERLDLLLDEALQRTHGSAAIPAVAPESLADAQPLDQPIDEEFRVGTITLAWQEEPGVVTIELFPVSPEQESESEDAAGASPETPPLDIPQPEATEIFVIVLEPGYAREFVRRAMTVVAAGRPPCPFCGRPLDPEGHLCPRANGFRRVAT
ncbi:MAG TPA: DUF3090 domain-containing protein [Nocardioidaceae bacterium]|nr:DUF3090 domain-containing protein [Nocardioidaceae bacterium]